MIRDLPSVRMLSAIEGRALFSFFILRFQVEKHTALLVAYMDKHPHDHGKLDQYLETVSVHFVAIRRLLPSKCFIKQLGNSLNSAYSEEKIRRRRYLKGDGATST